METQEGVLATASRAEPVGQAFEQCMRYTGQGVVQRRLEGVVVEIQKGGGRFAWPALELERWAVMQQFDVKIEFVEAAAHFQQRSEEHTSELQSLMRISYAVFCLKKK